MTSSMTPIRSATYAVDGAADWNTQGLPMRAVEVLLILFALFIPLESVLTTGTFTVTKAIGGLLFMAALLCPRQTLGRVPAVVAGVGIYILIDGLLTVLHGGDRPTMLRVMLTYIQSFGFLWIASNMLRNRRTSMNVMVAFIVGVVLTAVLGLLGFGATSFEEFGYERSSFGVRDANENALLHAWALVACFVLALAAKRWRKVLLLGLLPLLAAAMARTGSRTALLAGFLGVMVTFILGLPIMRHRTIMIGTSTVALVGCIALALSSETLRYRMLKSIEQRDTSMRNDLFDVTWQAFAERPLLGWGEGLIYQEITQRVGGSASQNDKVPHNEILGILATTGVVGVIPVLFVGAFACWKAWRARRTQLGLLALAMLLMLFAASMSLNIHYLKAAWLVLAFASAAPDSDPEQSGVSTHSHFQET
jgi:O-antigen ligase